MKKRKKEEQKIEVQVKDIKAKLTFKQLITVIFVIILAAWLIFNVSFSIKIKDFYFQSKAVKTKPSITNQVKEEVNK